MLWATLFFLAFCAFIVYTDASVETIFAFVSTVMVGSLVLGFFIGLL